MTDRTNPRLSTRRETLKIGGAVGVALAAGAALAHPAAAQDATPTMGGISTSVQTITADAATRLIEAAVQAVADLGVPPMAIAIVDSVGLLKAFHRMDGLDRAVTLGLVQDKAYTAASFRTPTHQLAESASANPAFLASVTSIPNFTLLGGGYPIADGDVVVGGIGVGGGSQEQDMEVAEAALAALAG
jgi:uncharacterized protein GlcG (DUF336 family)